LTLNSEGTTQHDWTENAWAFKAIVVNIETFSEIVLETERHRKPYDTALEMTKNFPCQIFATVT
jgi:hypothetical protein